ncbi:MAG: acetolactate synthase small subunit [Clostridium sp.]|jgi:acetolactate synthase-1/3 small subunit|nr:acetolactate synthase small subunit [Clostridium sp.]
MESNEKFTIGALVNNHYGVLNRVAGLFSKRGYNIDSLAVGETENPAYSRMTIVCTGGEYMRGQAVRQLRKLVDVISVQPLDDGSTVAVEHLLIKVRVNDRQKNSLNQLINLFNGKVRDFGADFITVEITAPPNYIDDFIEGLRPYGILETCRSGALAMSHGTGNMLTAPN